LSRKNPTPFDDILGYYSFPSGIRHHKIEKKSYLFVGDRWQEMGDIQFFFVQVTEDTGYFQVQPPDPDEYAEKHKEEGALDWLKWGPRVN
jgi:hypothetical protein